MAETLSTAILPDPTDFGNRPGDGPLRVGGKPGEPTRETDKPSMLSQQAEAQREAIELVRDLWAGAQKLREEGEKYLPKAPKEDRDNYNNRLARSAFFNAFRRAVEGLTGLVFRKDPVLGEDVPAKIRQHWENIDNAGTHGDVFCREVLQDALAAGHNAILVEFPQVSDDDRRTGRAASAEASGEIRPYWVPIKKENILSWRTTAEAGRTVLTQVVIRECGYVPVGRFGQDMQVRYRVLYRDGGVVGWVLLEETKSGGVIKVGEGKYPTQIEIPLAEIASSGRRSMFESDPPLLDLAYLNIAHYQMWSDYNWSIHKTCVPFIYVAGWEGVDEQGNKVALVIGSNAALTFPNPETKVGYVSHSGESLGSIKQALDDLKSDMGSLGLAMLAPQKRSAETAEAKRLDKATSDSALAVTARAVQDGIERALGFHARYLGEKSGGSIIINRDFEGLLMEPEVMQAVAALVKGGMPVMLALDMLQKGGRIDADADLGALEILWEIGYKAEADQKAMDQGDAAQAAA